MSLLELWNKKNLPSRQQENPFFNLQREMNSVFDNFFKGFDVAPWGELEKSFNPTVDVTETEEAYTIKAELAGLDEKDIELSIDENCVTLKGEKKQEKEEKKKNYYLKESSHGSFYRSFPIPSDVDSEKIVADFKKGVLNITLPKTEKSKKAMKKIQIKS